MSIYLPDTTVQKHAKKTGINIKEIILFIYTILILFIYILPSLKYKVSYPVSTTLMLLIVPYSFFTKPILRKYILGILVCALVTGIIFFLISYPFNYVTAIAEIIRIIKYFSPVILFMNIVDLENIKLKKLIFLILSIILIYVIIRTLKEIEINPMVARLLAKGSVDDELILLRFNNIGGFGFSYSLGAIVPFLTTLLWDARKLLHRICIITSLILLLFFIIKVQYTLLLILSIITIGIVIIKQSRSYGVIFSLLSMITILFSIGDFFAYLSKVVGGDRLAERLNSLAIFFYSGINNISILGSRPERILDALLLFLHSPIWGNTRIYDGYTFFGLDSHSTIFEILSLTGVIGFAVYLYIILTTYKLLSLKLRKTVKSLKSFNISFVYFIILSVLNPIHNVFELSIILFLYIPLGVFLYSNVNQVKTRIVFR